ncbi:MAG: type II secretion system protein [bacterium]
MIKNEKGFTLVELIFVLVILGMVTSVFSSTILTTLRIWDKTSNNTHNLAEIALERIVRQVRLTSADSISLTSTQIEFDTKDSDGNITRAIYRFDYLNDKLEYGIYDVNNEQWNFNTILREVQGVTFADVNEDVSAPHFVIRISLSLQNDDGRKYDIYSNVTPRL